MGFSKARIMPDTELSYYRLKTKGAMHRRVLPKTNGDIVPKGILAAALQA